MADRVMVFIDGQKLGETPLIAPSPDGDVAASVASHLVDEAALFETGGVVSP